MSARPVIVRCLNPLERAPSADRILVIRLGALGDVVRTLPAVSALRAHYPGAHLAWLVEPKAEGAVRALPGVDRVIRFPRAELDAALARRRPIELARRIGELVQELRRDRFDLVVDFHSILRSGLLSRLSGARTRVAFAPPLAREGGWLFATHRARLSRGRISRFARNAGLLRFLAVPETLATDFALEVDEEARRRVAAALDLAAPRGGRATVAMHPGSSPSTPYKRYGVSGYARVARALKEQEGLRSLVVAGSAPVEVEYARRIVEASSGAAQLAPETPTFADLAALLATCRLYVGGDSGPLHVASLVGTPVVQILGPTHPVENAPFAGTPSRTVRVPVPCSPCRRGCSAAICLKVVSPESVTLAARSLLQSGPGMDAPREPAEVRGFSHAGAPLPPA